jgi:predicted membrane chloride channel (bestrophin family)
MLLLPFLLINQFVTNPPFSMSWIIVRILVGEEKCWRARNLQNDLYCFRNSQKLVNSLAIILGGCEELSTLQLCFLSFVLTTKQKVLFNFNGNKERP